MTDALSTAILAAIAPTVAALAGLYVSIRNGSKTDVAVKKVEENIKKVEENTNTTNENAHKADVTIEKVAEIHTLTNSNLTQVKEELKAAVNELAEMKKFVSIIMEERSSRKQEPPAQ